MSERLFWEWLGWVWVVSDADTEGDSDSDADVDADVDVDGGSPEKLLETQEHLDDLAHEKWRQVYCKYGENLLNNVKERAFKYKETIDAEYTALLDCG